MGGLEDLKRLMEPLSNRISALISLGKLTLIKPGVEQLCQIEMLEDELRDRVPHHMPYGFTHVPLEGAEPMVAFLRGDKSGGVVIQIRDTRYQKTLKKGEVAIHDDQDQIIHIQRDGILIKSDKKITIESPDTLIKSKVEIQGALKVNNIDFSSHKHPDSHGGITGKPQ